MATSYTSFLGLALPVQGELSGTWGNEVNNYITTYLDSAIAGAITLTADTTLTKTTGSSLGATSSQYAIIIASPASANITITAPAASKAYIINNTSGTYTVKIVGAGPTTGVTLLASEKAIVAWNGSDFVKVASTSASAINAGTLPIANGGTGTTSTTFVNLASNVTGTLPVLNGGTGVTTSTGSGNNVLSTSPTLVTPILGTPASGNLANCTFPTLNQNTTGTAAGLSSTLAVSSGGTGLSSTPANGALDIGNGSGFTRTTLTAGANVTITNSAGGITIAASGGGGGGGTVTSVSGTGTVSGLTLSGTVTTSGNLTLGGAITGTGSGSVVLATSPTITTPVISGNTTVNGLALGNGISSGTNNTVFGLGAYSSATSGASNVAIGSSAFNSATTAAQSTMVGRGAGSGITTQSSNTCIGYFTAIGTIGTSNTAVGSIALSGTTGTGAAFNTAIGYSALDTLTTYQNSSGIGYNAQVTGSNQVQLGDASTTTYVYGTVQNRSDLRDKADVRDTQLGLNFVNALRPVDYKLDMRDDYKPARPDDVENAEAMAAWREASKIENLTHDGSKKRSRFHHGLIAQEVKAVLDAQGIDFGGFQDHKIAGGNDVLTIGYDELIAPLIKAIQELTARVQELEAK